MSPLVVAAAIPLGVVKVYNSIRVFSSHHADIAIYYILPAIANLPANTIKGFC